MRHVGWTAPAISLGSELKGEPHRSISSNVPIPKFANERASQDANFGIGTPDLSFANEATGRVKVSMVWLHRIAVLLLLGGISAAEAAPLVAPGDLPGRERYRFTPSPLTDSWSRSRGPNRCYAGTATIGRTAPRRDPAKRGIADTGLPAANGCVPPTPPFSSGARPAAPPRRRAPRARHRAAARSGLPAEAADRDRALGRFLAPDHEQRRHLGKRMLAHLVIDLLVAQVGLDAQARRAAPPRSPRARSRSASSVMVATTACSGDSHSGRWPA